MLTPIPRPVCRKCGSIQLRQVEVHHGFHAVLTVCTLGLWGISWLASWIHARFLPWRCQKCYHSQP